MFRLCLLLSFLFLASSVSNAGLKEEIDAAHNFFHAQRRAVRNAGTNPDWRVTTDRYTAIADTYRDTLINIIDRYRVRDLNPVLLLDLRRTHTNAVHAALERYRNPGNLPNVVTVPGLPVAVQVTRMVSPLTAGDDGDDAEPRHLPRAQLGRESDDETESTIIPEDAATAQELPPLVGLEDNNGAHETGSTGASEDGDGTHETESTDAGEAAPSPTSQHGSPAPLTKATLESHNAQPPSLLPSPPQTLTRRPPQEDTRATRASLESGAAIHTPSRPILTAATLAAHNRLLPPRRPIYLPFVVVPGRPTPTNARVMRQYNGPLRVLLPLTVAATPTQTPQTTHTTGTHGGQTQPAPTAVLPLLPQQNVTAAPPQIETPSALRNVTHHLSLMGAGGHSGMTR